MSSITIKGAREHNLKNLSVEIPKNQLVVFTGLSGSGKSSLAFDTIYAEGQRRYVESLSSYARQFLGVMDKPDVDSIEGLSPAISIDQKSVSHNPRSTVGTVTEIYDYLRLLFARIGHPHCPNCGQEISQQSSQQIVDQVLKSITEESKMKRQVRFMLLAPVVRDRKGEFTQLFDNLMVRGYSKVRIDGQIFGLNDDIVLIKTNKHAIDVVVDRVSVEKKHLSDQVAKSNLRTRLTDAVEQCLKLTEGLCIISFVADKALTFPEKPENTEDHLFSERFACPNCNLSFPEVEPRTFSFNSPHGACPTCTGIGSLLKVDQSLTLNPNLSISEGGILPFTSMFEHDTWFSRIVKTVCVTHDIDIRAPLARLTKEQIKLLLSGTGEETYKVEGTNREGRWTQISESFHGITFELEKRYKETESEFVRAEIAKFMRQEVCPACGGGRLKKEALGITIGGKSIVEISGLSIGEALGWIDSLSRDSSHLNHREETIAEPIVKEIRARLGFLLSVGLDYLTLDRAAATLAGGEGQRIRLASQIGSGLSGVLYVLDEPSVGLHQRDNSRLISTLKTLRDLGNTVIVVEHDREMMEESDRIFDFGPGAGEHGGKIVAQGTLEEIKKNRDSLTGQYLSNEKKIQIRRNDRIKDAVSFKAKLEIKGCSQYNLKSIDVTFPLGNFICVSGVSGSGKSTLIVETLYHALATKLNPFHRQKPGTYRSLSGQENIDKVILIDQSPIGRTPRSNPATYTGAFTTIRELFSLTGDARVRGYRSGRFSFNVRGGRCEVCEGGGQIKIEMQFLPDVYVDCEVCHGLRYNRETLEVTYKGKNIAEVLDMTVREAQDFFQPIPGLYERLKTLSEVGLSYMRLGQSAPTISGGEAQRVKLATELAKRPTGHTFYILDEPTTGLHFADLEKLIGVLSRLVDKGNTVVVIEHNLDVLKNADWLIDLGPEGGNAGGRIVAQGLPHQVTNASTSFTGSFLKKIIN